jgi:hypothetical protein
MKVLEIILVVMQIIFYRGYIIAMEMQIDRIFPA